MTTHITKTWFDGKNIVTQEIPVEEVYKREWVGLTDDEITWAVEWNGDRIKFSRAIEAKLKEKNTCTPPIAADPKAFHGFPSGSVSTPNAGGKCVTAGETAPIKEIDPNAWAFDRGLEST